MPALDDVTNGSVVSEGWHLTQTRNHWSSLESMQDYIRRVIVPWINKKRIEHNAPESHAVLLFDCWSVHKSAPFLEWLKSSYPEFHPLFVPAGCTSKAQPADLVLQRPMKHAFSNEYTMWMTNEMTSLLKAGAAPEQLRVDTGMKRMKPLVVKWMMTAWQQLRARSVMIKKGWTVLAGVMDDQVQKTAMSLVISQSLSMTVNDGKVEPEPVSQSDVMELEDESNQNEDEDIEDDEEEADIDICLAAVSEDRPIAGVRRSARIQMTEDDRRSHQMAQLMQEQDVQEILKM